MSTILPIRLAAAKILAEREFLQLTENIENFLTLSIRSGIPAKSKRDGKHSKSEQTVIRKSA
jgi:hypothetical protein